MLEFKDVVQKDVETTGIKGYKTYTPKNVQRQVIRIDDIQAVKREYHSKRKILSKELINSPTDRVALFANVHIPNHFRNQDCIQFYLHVNGVRIQVEPINSNKEGTKIIKQNTFIEDNAYVYTVGELIKSVKLEVTMETEDAGETPYVSNIKLVQGRSDLT